MQRMRDFEPREKQKIVDRQFGDPDLRTRSQCVPHIRRPFTCKVEGELSDSRKLTPAREKFNGNMRRAFVKLRPPISPFSFLLIQADRARPASGLRSSRFFGRRRTPRHSPRPGRFEPETAHIKI
jgi:hypothetical protein